MMPTGFGGGKGVIILLFILFGLWLMTGIYRVNPQEQGVVMRFGEWVRTTPPGLHYHLPIPIEKVITPDVTRKSKKHKKRTNKRPKQGDKNRKHKKRTNKRPKQ